MICAPTDTPRDTGHNDSHLDVAGKISLLLKSKFCVHDVGERYCNQKSQQIGQALRQGTELVKAAKGSPMDPCVEYPNSCVG